MNEDEKQDDSFEAITEALENEFNKQTASETPVITNELPTKTLDTLGEKLARLETLDQKIEEKEAILQTAVKNRIEELKKLRATIENELAQLKKLDATDKAIDAEIEKIKQLQETQSTLDEEINSLEKESLSILG